MKARALALGRLVRLSLAPSALADAAAGIVAGHGTWPAGSAPWLLIVASACVYHGGMSLNDWADRVQDGKERPDRPIPSGLVPASAALAISGLLLVAGAVFAWCADPAAGLLMSAVALAAIAYDLAGRGPLRGPLLLGLCRAGNLGAGLLLGLRLSDPDASPLDAASVPALWVLPLLYGAYVFFVSRLGRLEDGEATELNDGTPARLLRFAGILLLTLGMSAPLLTALPAEHAHALPGLPWSRIILPFLIAAGGSRGLFQAAGARSWTRGDVLRSMGLCLRRLLVVTAAVAVAAGSWDGVAVAACILCGYPASFWLRRVFPPS